MFTQITHHSDFFRNLGDVSNQQKGTNSKLNECSNFQNTTHLTRHKVITGQSIGTWLRNTEQEAFILTPLDGEVLWRVQTT